MQALVVNKVSNGMWVGLPTVQDLFYITTGLKFAMHWVPNSASIGTADYESFP